MRSLLLCCLFALSASVSADEAKPLLCAPGKLISAPTLREPLGPQWSTGKGRWDMADGVITPTELPEEHHVPVLHLSTGPVSLVVECEFRLNGSKFLGVGCDGAKHVGRLTLAPKVARLAEDSTEVKGQVPSHVLAESAVDLAPDTWHRLRVEYAGDQMAARVDGLELRAQHPFLATPKVRWWFAASTGTEIRNIRVSEGKPLQETDPRLHADGPGWRLQKALVTDPTLPRVLLMGDSILNGYLPAVTKALEGKAYVDAWVTPTSQGDKSLPKQIKDVTAQGPYDVIHFNLGLHGWQKGRIPEGQFEPLTHAMVRAFKEDAPHARLIWASTTPVTRQDHPGELDPEINPVIVEHNAMAAKVMQEEGVPIDDLGALMMPHLDLARGDRFHWRPEGTAMLAQQVADTLLQALPARAAK